VWFFSNEKGSGAFRPTKEGKLNARGAAAAAPQARRRRRRPVDLFACLISI